MTRILSLTAIHLLAGCSNHGAIATSADHPANPDAGGHVDTQRQRPAATPPSTTHDHAAHKQAHPPTSAAEPQAGTLYMCPMHSKVTSRNPEDRCPECGMKINQPVPPETPK